MEKAFVAKGMVDFCCLGQGCEDTCCAGWVVPLERKQHKRLLVLAADRPAMKEKLESSVHFEPESEVGAFVFDEGGRCRMLTKEGLCSIHAELGDEALFDVCVTYPRYASFYGERVEILGALSCPEVTRRSLFTDDGLDFAEVSYQTPRLTRNTLNTKDAYEGHFLRVRGALLDILTSGNILTSNLTSSSYKLDARFFLVLYGCEKLSEVYRRGGAELPAKLLDEFFLAFGSSRLQEALAKNFALLPGDSRSVLNLGTQVLFTKRAKGVKESRMGVLTKTFGESFGFGAEVTLPLEDAQLDAAEELLRRSPLSPHHEALVTRTIERFARHSVYLTPFVVAETPFLHFFELTLRAATLRFFLRGLLLTKMACSEEEVQELLVRAVYAFARENEHSDVFQRLVHALAQEGRVTLGSGAALAKALTL